MKIFYQHPRYDWWVEIEEKDGNTFAQVLPCLVEGAPELKLDPYPLGNINGTRMKTYIGLLDSQGLERVLILP